MQRDIGTRDLKILVMEKLWSSFNNSSAKSINFSTLLEAVARM